MRSVERVDNEVRGRKYTFGLLDWRDNGSDLFEKLVRLQMRVWEFGIDAAVPDNFLSVVGEIGGDVLAAFDESGEARGFLFTVPTKDPKTLFLHMVGVDPMARSTGLGESLMILEADLAEKRGVENIIWTYDPLRAGNARLYIAKLGAVGFKYTVNKYGVYPGLYGDSPTDRFTLNWKIKERERFSKQKEKPMVKVINDPDSVRPGEPFLVKIPDDVDALADADVQNWRVKFRAIALRALSIEERDSHIIKLGTHLVTGFYSAEEDNRRVNYYLFTPIGK